MTKMYMSLEIQSLQKVMIHLFEDFGLKVHSWFIFWSLGLKIDTHTLLDIA